MGGGGEQLHNPRPFHKSHTYIVYTRTLMWALDLKRQVCCRWLQIACITPSSTNTTETMNTLRYASRAKKIKSKPTVKMVSVVL